MLLEVSQNEQNENGNDDILAKEIESWKDFRYALREENAVLFNKMLSESVHNKATSKLLSPNAKTIRLNHYLCS